MRKRTIAGLALGCLLLAPQIAAAAADSYTIDFEGGKTFIYATDDQGVGPVAPGALTTKKIEVISGEASFKLDSMESDREWNEMYWSDFKVIQLEPNEVYTIDMDYKILVDDGNYFYFLFRSYEAGPGENDRAWTTWTMEEGETGHKTVTFETGDFTDYYLDIGNHFTGSMTIDNIVIRKGE